MRKVDRLAQKSDGMTPGEDVTSGPAHKYSVNWTHFLYAGLILLVFVAFYQATQTESLLRKISKSQRDNEALRHKLSLSEQQFRSSLIIFRSDLTSLQAELSQARQQADSSLEKAQAATQYADKLAGTLEKKKAGSGKAATAVERAAYSG